MENSTNSITVSNTVNLSQLAATSVSAGQGQARTAKTQGSDTVRLPVDNVDLGNFQTISQAFKLLENATPLPVPEPVYRAIQALARDVMEGLPGGGRSVH